MDLFFQQIISYPSTRILDQTANATISSVHIYDPPRELLYYNLSGGYQYDSQFDSFVRPFWQSSGIAPGVDFSCPTGNCTYDPFHTLALDFQCKEMSNALEFGCHDVSAEWMAGVDFFKIVTNNLPMPNVSSCGWYLDVPNNGKKLMSGYEVQADGTVGEILSTRFFPVMDVASNELYWNGSLNFKDVNLPVVDFILASTPGGFDGARNNNTPTVTECEIHWVIKKLQASVNAGHLEEEALETIQFESDTNNPWDLVDGSIWTANFTKTLTDPVSGVSTTFGMDNTTAFKVWEVWMELAPSTFNLPVYPKQAIPVTGVPQSGPVFKFWWASNPIARVAEMYNLNSPWAPPNNVTEHMAEAVNVMNQVLRRNSLSTSRRDDDAVGKAFIYVVLVSIRWKWLSLPLILLVFSLIFLIATVVRSTRDQDNIGIFKTSALAILFNGLGDDVQEQVGSGNNRMGYTRERARDIKVRLDDD
jgi:hypothetical protein